MKKRIIHLTRKNTLYPSGKPYLVDKVINSVQYTPGDYLTLKEVEALCESLNWTVNIGKTK